MLTQGRLRKHTADRRAIDASSEDVVLAPFRSTLPFAAVALALFAIFAACVLARQHAVISI